MADQNLTNTLAQAAVITAGGIFVSKALAYLYRAIIARELGPNAYGQLNLGITVAAFGLTISTMALHQAVQKFVPQYRAEDNDAAWRSIVRSALHITTPLSIVIALITIVSADFIATNIFHDPSLTPVIYIMGLSPVFESIGKIYTSAILGFKKVTYQVFSENIIMNIVQITTTAIFIYILGWGLLGAAAGWVLGTIAFAISSAYFMEKKINPVLISSDTEAKHRREIFAFSAPLIVSAFIATLLGNMDTALLGILRNPTEVGYYNAAFPTALLLMIPFQALGRLALPSMSELVETDEKELANTLKMLTRWTLTISFPLFTLMALFSPQVLHILFGPEYVIAADSLVMLSIGYIFAACTGHIAAVIKAFSETKIILKNSVAKLGVNLVLNLALIPIFGIFGAAIATSASIIFINFLMLAELYYLKKIHPFRHDSIKPVIACIPGLVVLYFSYQTIFDTVPLWSLIPGVLIFGAIYLITLVKIGGIKDKDIEILLAAGRKYGHEEQAEILAELLRH